MMILHMNTKNHQNLDLIIWERKRVISQILLQRLIVFIYYENPNFQYIPLTQDTISQNLPLKEKISFTKA